jgi:hypothetical protein
MAELTKHLGGHFLSVFGGELSLRLSSAHLSFILCLHPVWYQHSPDGSCWLLQNRICCLILWHSTCIGGGVDSIDENVVFDYCMFMVFSFHFIL